jgi:hypothetical protein
LKDPNSTRRKGAAQALKELGPNAEGAVPALIDALADKENVFEVVEALGAIGPKAVKAVPALLILLESRKGGIRWWLDEALRKIDPVTADRVSETPKLFREKPFTCAALAQAVNHFVALGETTAVWELEDLTLDWVKDHEKAGFSRNERIGWVCRILFQPTEKEPLREPRYGGHSSLPDRSMPLKTWPLYPVASFGKSYFVLSEGYSLRGVAEDPKACLKYCRTEGRFLKDEVPIPTRDQALKDAEELRKSDAWKAIKWKDSGPGFSYTLSEERAWSFIKGQAEAIPTK